MYFHFKNISLNLIKLSGFFYVSNRLSRKTLKILIYHRFGKSSRDGKVSKDIFEKQLIYLKKHYTLIGLEKALKFIHLGEMIPDNCVIITVDDGYQDFYHFAYPMLCKYSIPATVFLTTDFIDDKIWLWHDVINYSLSSTKKNYLELWIDNNKIKLCA